MLSFDILTRQTLAHILEYFIRSMFMESNKINEINEGKGKGK